MTPTARPTVRRGVLRVGAVGDGGTYVLRVGQTLVVALGPNWTAPRANAVDPSATAGLTPLRTDASTGFPAAASATFTAVRTGFATITADTDYPCLHSTPRCALPVRRFAITVDVRPHSGGRAGPKPAQPTP